MIKDADVLVAFEISANPLAVVLPVLLVRFLGCVFFIHFNLLTHFLYSGSRLSAHRKIAPSARSLPPKQRCHAAPSASRLLIARAIARLIRLDTLGCLFVSFFCYFGC